MRNRSHKFKTEESKTLSIKKGSISSVYVFLYLLLTQALHPELVSEESRDLFIHERRVHMLLSDVSSWSWRSENSKRHPVAARWTGTQVSMFTDYSNETTLYNIIKHAKMVVFFFFLIKNTFYTRYILLLWQSISKSI